MNRAEFLKELDRKLKYIPVEDREDAINYYDEYIGDSGLDENADVTAILGTPKEVASKIIADCTAKYATEQTEKKTIKGGAKTAWLVVLGIASLPISLPLAITAIALALTCLIALAAVILAVGLSGFAACIVGVVVIVRAFFIHGIGQVLITVGTGLLGIGLGAMFVLGAYLLVRLFIKVVATIASKRRKGE